MSISVLCAVSLHALMHNIMMIFVTVPSCSAILAVPKQRETDSFFLHDQLVWKVFTCDHVSKGTLNLTLTPTYVYLLCVCGRVWPVVPFPSSLNLFFLFSVPLCRLRLHCSDQMAFCLAELHLWSTQSSLKVKGNTYHHVQSPTLSIILSLALSVITHFVSTPSSHLSYIYINNQTLSQHQLLVCSHFLFALWRLSYHQFMFVALHRMF